MANDRIRDSNIGTLKDRNGMGLAESEDVKKRWQENIQKLSIKDLNDPVNNMV